MNWSKAEINFVKSQFKKGLGKRSIHKLFNRKFTTKRTVDSINHCISNHCSDVERDLPKILILDVETKPKKAYIWTPRVEYVNNDMLIEDGAIMSWSAKWLGDPDNKVMYADQRGNEKNLQNDYKIMKQLRDLMDQADGVLWQNGDAFDYGEINARFIEHGIEFPSEYFKIDTKKIAKKHLRIPYYSLGYMTSKYNKKYKKLSHKEFPGFSMWEACMQGNRKAWNCMKEYNKFDVLSLEELFVNTLSKVASGNANVAAAMRTYNSKKNNKK